MLRNKPKCLLVSLLLGLLLCSAAMAQYAIPTSVVSSGAANMSGSAYGIMGTVGQPVIGAVSGAANADSQGFWYTVGRAAALAVNNPALTIPASFALAQNYPNPFNPTTEIHFQVPNTARVTIKVFNINGQLVETLADQNFSAGEHIIRWNADRHATGLYLIRMSAPGFSEIRRAVLLK